MKINKFSSFVALLATLLFWGDGVAAAEDYRPLFADPNAWEVLGGKARFILKDGVLTGDQPENYFVFGGNSFFTSKKSYSDFILELEYKMTPDANSGVQFRSRFDPNKGNISGYQSEIDHGSWPGGHFWTGGVYEEKGRGWLYPGTRGGDSEKVTALVMPLIRLSDWNQMKIEAIGTGIKIWINGQLVTEMTDDSAASGVIAFQVHATFNPFNRHQVQFRNVKIKEL